jgi:hypothetical protein
LQLAFLIKKPKAKGQHLSVIHLWWEEWIKLHIQVAVGVSPQGVLIILYFHKLIRVQRITFNIIF